MVEQRKPTADSRVDQAFEEPFEQVLARLEEYFLALAQDHTLGPRLQARAQDVRNALTVARGEWWRIGLEVRGLRQRVAHLEGEVARLERYVGKITSALDESEWTSGA
jgi:hypothetical protein